MSCGRTMGHGESCSEGWLCGSCQAVEQLHARVAELEAQMNNIRYVYQKVDLNAAVLSPSLLFDLSDAIYLPPDKFFPRVGK